MTFFCAAGGSAHLQGFGAFGQQFLDVPRRRRHQLLRVVGLHGEVGTVLVVHLRQREVRGQRDRNKGSPFTSFPGPDLAFPECISRLPRKNEGIVITLKGDVAVSGYATRPSVRRRIETANTNYTAASGDLTEHNSKGFGLGFFFVNVALQSTWEDSHALACY